MSTTPEPTLRAVRPVLLAELQTEDGAMPVYVHAIDHPRGRVLVDTGLTRLHPAIEDMSPRLVADHDDHGIGADDIDIVVNTHLHFDHCGGNHLFPDRPIYVQRRELDDARAGDHTIIEWVDAPGLTYVPVDGTVDLLPGVRLLAAPGHTAGSQIVVVELEGQRHVIAGDTAVTYQHLDEPDSEGQRLIRWLEPDLVWLSHQHEPWSPRTLGRSRSGNSQGA